jgi:transposase
MSGYNIAKLFPFRSVKITKIDVADDKKVIVYIEPDRRCTPVCSGCLQKVSSVHSYRKRILRDMPMSGAKALIIYTYRTLRCPKCGQKVEHHDFVEPYSRITSRYSHYVYQLCKVMSIYDVATHTGLSWDQVRHIDRKHLAARFSEQTITNIDILCIDEISIKKRHNYLTIIADYMTGRVIHVARKRTYETVVRFLKSLSKQTRTSIKAVAMDMWNPYIKAFTRYCPHASIVFDPFHVIAAFSRVIDKIRVEQYRNADHELKNIMKRSRFLLLKNPENLNDKERPRLERLLKENELLSSVYLLKAYLKRIWQYKRPGWARKFLDYWCTLAYETGCRHLIGFAKMLLRHSYGLINHCHFPIHTGKLEGINNKIKLIKRKAYGFRDIEYFILKIMQATCN